MGEYAPDDQRMVHRNAGPDQSMSDWHAREEAQQEQGEGEAQAGYGNARNEDGTMEQDVATESLGNQPLAQDTSAMGDAQPGEISNRPDERAAADANRPLGRS